MLPTLLVNGLPGNMARIVITHALERGLSVVETSLTGPGVADSEVLVQGRTFRLIPPERHEEALRSLMETHSGLIVVDYTHPSAVNANARLYSKAGVPFVMGTTGGDRVLLEREADDAGIPCVIAPNMAKGIVAFQAMIEHLATNYPSAFSGYQLKIVESHQKTKADTSGTAKAVAASFRKMGFLDSETAIEMVREEEMQVERMGVPKEYLGGHAFHTYSLDSQDGTVHFEFQHNVCGRTIYAEGTLDAVEFLASKLASGDAGRRWNMMDVLRSGAMR